MCIHFIAGNSGYMTGIVYPLCWRCSYLKLHSPQNLTQKSAKSLLGICCETGKMWMMFDNFKDGSGSLVRAQIFRICEKNYYFVNCGYPHLQVYPHLEHVKKFRPICCISEDEGHQKDTSCTSWFDACWDSPLSKRGRGLG